MSAHIVSDVAPGSPLDGRVFSGDELIAIDGESVLDLFDYQRLADRRNPVLTLMRGAQRISLRARKGAHDPLGLSFSDDLLGETITCCNNCVFCFVDQLPAGMRPSLQVKDDDWRLSVLMGGYVTLTNVSDAELQRILRDKIGPLYVSVHATDEDVRARLLGCASPRPILADLRALSEAGITVHTQVVLCPAINDGETLARTLRDLSALWPQVASLALVPVGLTEHRCKLTPLRAFTREEARSLIARCEAWQRECLSANGTRFVFPADELMLRADVPLPPFEAYEDFPQIENGVGMLRLFQQEFLDELADAPPVVPRRVAVLTGESAAPFLRTLAAQAAFPGVEVQVIAAPNRLLGRSVSVAGLVCGADALAALSGVQADEVLLPRSMLREGGDVFLDGVSLADFASRAPCPVRCVEVNGGAFLRALCGA